MDNKPQRTGNILDNVINHIKDKKELRLLDDSYIESIISREFSKNRKLERLFNECESFDRLKKKREYIVFFKDIRAKLRKAHGLFKSKDEYLSNYERDYGMFNDFIAEEIEESKADNIIDLGAGLNPLSISKGNYDAIKAYYAFEIDKNLIGRLDKEKPSKKLVTGYLNLLDFKLTDELEKAKHQNNLILLLKVLEALEAFKKDYSEQLITQLKRSFPKSRIIVSFAKISSGGNQAIRKSGRSWFRRILGRLKKQGMIKDVKIEDLGNEIIFIID